MTIQRKFHFLMGIVIVALSVMIWLTSSSARTLVGLERQAVMIAQVEAGMLTLRRNEKDFLARNQPKYAEQFDANLQALQAEIQDLSSRLAASGIDETHIRELGVVLGDYGERFAELVALQQKIGLSPKQGLYGSLRDAVHQVEAAVKEQQDYRLLSDMLTLRRNEKDFMLREDPKYIDKLVKNVGVFEQHLAASDIPADQQAQIAALLNRYRSDFLALADAYKQRGLTAEQGLHGAMRDTVHSSEQLLSRIDTQVVGAVDAHIVSARVWAFAVGTGILATVVAVLFWLCRSITGPVNRLAAIMREAAQQRDLTLRADEGAGGELGQMAGAFNFMMGELQVLIERLRQSAALVGTASRQLAEVTTTAARGVELQRTESDQVATAMNEMAATVQEVARHAVDAAAASSEADSEAGQGTRVVGQTVDGISRLAREVEQTADTIQALEQESANIGTVLSVITGIAEQTNLLALNAAIEAARAGEQGRGFAVVADEVRTLAQRSQRSTEEIKTIIDRLQAKAQDAVKAMGSGRSQAGQSVEQAQQAGASLTAIAQAITTIRDMNTQIAGAAEEQSAVADEINRSVVRIAQVAEESAVGVEQITRTSDELAGLAEDLQARVNVFRLEAASAPG